MPSLREVLNDITPHNLAEYLAQLDLGDVLVSLPTALRNKVPAADAYALATLQVVKLPDNAKASVILRATGRTGTTTGEFAAQAFGATPTTGQVAVTPAGDIAFLGTDAVTLADVVYVPEKGKVVEITLPVASNVLTLPTSLSAVLLLEAEATEATSTGKKIPLVPGAGAPSAGQARLNVAKTTVTFNGTDAVTKARVKVLVVPDADVSALLAASPSF